MEEQEGGEFEESIFRHLTTPARRTSARQRTWVHTRATRDIAMSSSGFWSSGPKPAGRHNKPTMDLFVRPTAGRRFPSSRLPAVGRTNFSVNEMPTGGPHRTLQKGAMAAPNGEIRAEVERPGGEVLGSGKKLTPQWTRASSSRSTPIVTITTPSR